MTSSDRLWCVQLPSARWFQGKGLTIQAVAVRPFDWYVSAGPVWVRSELAEVVYADHTETYHLLVGYLDAGAGEPAALVGQTVLPGRGLVDVVDAPSSPTAMAAFLSTRGYAGGTSSRVFTGEQSNTTVRIGEEVLLKVFRRVEPGRNCESEVMGALAGSGLVPRLMDTLVSPDGTYDLGVFTQYIPGARDGWTYAVAAREAGTGMAPEMAALGTTLRRLHAGLAAAFGSTTVPAAAIGVRLLDHLEAARGQAPELDDVIEPLRRLVGLDGGSVPVQRVHGDFHLGQALLAPTGWYIIDFEGEPLKSAEERAAPDSVWRDVAGLTRSLDYAGAGPAARAAFLDAYCDGDPLPERLLTAYEVDKAVYELVYELRNRPAWADIPRQAIAGAVRTVP